jgi:hypothetical protein
MSQPSYTRWENPNGPGDRCRGQLERIATALGTTAAALFGGES